MTLIISPLAEVEELLRRHRPSHVVTILAPTDFVPDWSEANPHERLVLQFHDIDMDIPGFVAPDEAAIARLLSFAESWAAADTLLVHCWAGVSRSTAAGFIIACARSGPGREHQIAQKLRAAAPFATPNPMMVRLADTVLGRGGAMCDAIAEIGHGAQAVLGQSFVLPLSNRDTSRKTP
jgi:predicted protein tyrosine phosphatase